ncbi:MAG TPA: Rrf2 family transcriptional regulator [Sphingomonadaceae bacterium]|nr:Rrf2 family transcriptional regulator [Sphingomonadaceae bacterium]
MQLSLHSDYALRILMALAARKERLSVDDVARQYGISRNHLAKVAQELQALGYIVTTRGRGGGMELARPAKDIVVGEVVREFEKLDSFVSCMGAPAAGCAVDGVCGLKPALSGALAAFLAHLDGYTLADLTPNPKAFLARLAA